MKKLLLSALALCMALFVSCSKNSDSAASSGGGGNGGSSNPGKRIYEKYRGYEHSTYVSHDNGLTWDSVSHYELPYELEDVYHWDGNKLLSIDHYYNGLVSMTTNYEYNEAGLVIRKIWGDISVEGEIFNYSYNDNSQMIKYEYSKYYNNIVYHNWSLDFVWSNNKPVRIIPSENINIATSLIWTGENITRLESYNNPGAGYVELIYDNKNNPLYIANSLTPYAYWNVVPYYLSTNNLLSYRQYPNPDKNRSVTYTYEYDGNNFPVEVYETEIKFSEREDGLYKHIYVTHYTYTYYN